MPRAYPARLSVTTVRVEDRRSGYSTAAFGRRRPSIDVQAKILTDQNARCLYCGCRFGAIVRRFGHRDVVLRLEWDHLVPFAYLHANPDDNWAAACHVCNNIKADRIFDTVEEARDFIVARRKARLYVPAEWTPTLEEQEERDIREILASRRKRETVRFVGIKPESSKRSRLVSGNYVKVRQIIFVFEDVP